MEFEDNKIKGIKKLSLIKDQFDNSMKILEKNIAESIVNKKKLNYLRQDLIEANKKFVEAEKYLEDIKVKLTIQN
jgi:hypothetical protein